MKTETLMPFVSVYRDQSLDVEKILSIVKKAEDPKYSSKLIEGFSPWMDFGYTCKTRSSLINKIEGENNSDLINDHIYVVKTISDLLDECYKDYIQRWIGSEQMDSYNNQAKIDKFKTPLFQEHDYTWDIKDPNSRWIETTIDFVKFNADRDDQYILHYHVDNCTNNRVPCPHAIISSTIYLNDDYDSGEVSFINEFFENVVEYKPKAGDITIFPSSVPFFHASKPPLKSDKYFARHFLTWDSEGTKEWHDLVEKYGEDTAHDINMYLRKYEEEVGIYNRDVVLPSDNYFDRIRYNGIPFFAKEVIKINGKDIS